MSKAFLEIVGAALTLVGGIVGACGTYFLLRWYQFFRGREFLGSVLETLGTLVTGGAGKAIGKIRVQADFNPNTDDRATSLFGIHLIFIGFALQATGAIFLTADAIIQNLCQAH